MANNEGFSSIGTKMSFTTTPPELPVDAEDPPTEANLLASYTGINDFVEWDRLSTIGDIGPEDEIIEWIPVGSGIVEKIQSVRNNGDQDMEAAHVPENPGQIMFVGAQRSRTNLTVKEELPSGEILYYRAIPRSARLKVGDGKGMLMITPKMSVTGAITVDDSAVGTV